LIRTTKYNLVFLGFSLLIIKKKNQVNLVRIFLLFIVFTIAASCSNESEPKPELPDFIIDIKGEYLSTGEGWVILSNPDGEVISTMEIENNTTQTIAVPDGHQEGDVYSLTFLEHYVREDNGNHEYFINSYLALQPSHFQLENKNKVYTIIGNHSIIINNSPSTSNFGAFGLNVFYGHGINSSGTTHLTCVLYAEPADAYYYFFENNDNTPLYKRYQLAHVNEILTIDFDDMIPMENETVLNMGAVDESSYQFFSFQESNYDWPFYMHYVLRSGSEAHELPIYHPNFSLAEFAVTITSTTDDVTKSYTSLGTSVPSVFKSLEAEISSFTISSDVISFESTGTFDHLSALAGNEFTGTSDYFRWVMDMPQELPSDYKIPAIPDEILSTNPSLAAYSFDFKDVTLFDYASLDSYEDFIEKKLIVNESVYKTSKEIFSKSFDLN